MNRQRYYDEDYAPARPSNIPAFGVMIAFIFAAVAFVLWLHPDISLAPAGNAPAVGNQAPASAVRRGAQSIPTAAAVQQSIDAYNATAQAGAPADVATPAPLPLPLNSVGQPVIDQAQQAQMNQSLVLAEQEGAAAADQQLQAQRATADAASLARPPDVSKADAEQMLHRPLCSVPHANPATCASGLYKPTPVN